MRVYLNKIDLKGMKLQSDGKTSWVQVFRLGHWKHPRYGVLKFTEEIFKGFIKSFKDNVRKVELAIDAEHEPEKGALAWFKDLKSEDGGLWALVEWTSRGLNLVSDRVFKYLSGDFDYEWKDEETGKKFKNVLFGAALTNRPFIKGMSPINLSEFVKELENDDSIRNSFQLAEDIIKLKEGDNVKTDAEILVAKDADLSVVEKARKVEIMKDPKNVDVIALKKKKLAERAKKIGLAEDATEEDVKKKELEEVNAEALKKRAIKVGLVDNATEEEVKKKELEEANKEKEKKELSERALKVGLPETATLEEVSVKETEVAAKGDKVIPNVNEQKVKMAVALGLAPTATIEEIHAAATKVITAAREIEGSARTMSERAVAIGLSESATETEVVTKEKELSEKKASEAADRILEADIPTLEKTLSEMKSKGTDALTIKLLEETISGKKALNTEKVTNAKEKITLKLKEHFRAGKMTAKEKDILTAILFSEIDTGESSYKLSEKDAEGKDVEATRTLGEIIDTLLEDRPAIIELSELAKKELQEPPKEEDKEVSEEEAKKVAARVSKKVTGSSKTAKELSKRAKKLGLPSNATLEEIEKKEKGE